MKRIFSSKHPLAIRWFHWINFPVLFVMIWSGTLIYWANSVYKVQIGTEVLFRFYPPSVYKTLNIPHRLAEGMSYHFVFMWLFCINGLLYVAYLLLSGEWRLIFPSKRSFKEAIQTILYDLRLRKQKPPQVKYNGAQRIAYSLVIIMGLLSLISGLVIYKPVEFTFLTTLMGGYENARLIHFVLTLLFVLFFLVHVIQVLLAGWNNFRAMVTGWEVVKIEEPLNPENGNEEN